MPCILQMIPPPVDTAMEYEEQLEAEQNIQERILQANALDDAALQYQQNRYYLLHLWCVQHRWQDLYESDKHFRRQAAIRRQLAMNAQARRNGLQG